MKWHILLLIALSCISIIDIVSEFKSHKEKFKKYGTPIIIGKVVVALLLLSYTIYEVYDKHISDERDKSYGEVLPDFKQSNSYYPDMYFGGTLHSNSGSIISINEDNTLSAHVENGKLLLTAKIKDAHGNTLVDINKEGWQAYSSDIDFNNDNTAFEVVRADKKVIFQIELKGNVLYCNGIFFSGNAYIRGDDNGIHQGFIQPHMERVWLPEKHNLPRIFRYPRGQNYQKREAIK